MENIIYLANAGTVVGPEGAQAAAAAAPAAAPAAAAAAQGATSTFASAFMNQNTQLILTMALVFGIMYFFTIRPQRKREKELKEIQDGIKAGDWIVTFSGLYGKVTDVGSDVLMVEFGTNRGVRIPVKRAELTKASEPIISNRKEEDSEDKDKK